jgi:hypothetical protein
MLVRASRTAGQYVLHFIKSEIHQNIIFPDKGNKLIVESSNLI